MNDNHQDYHYMRDQYLELLWTAQKVEDRRLTELILRRLKDTAREMTVAPTPACEVIPFPCIVRHPSVPGYDIDVIHSLWPQQPLRHLLSFLCGYCGTVVFFAIFGISA